MFAAGFALMLSLSAVWRTEMQLWSNTDSAVVYVAVLFISEDWSTLS